MPSDRPQRTVCPTCLGDGRILHFYARGPNDPPGNTYVGCPDCDKGRAYDKVVRAETLPTYTTNWQIHDFAERLFGEVVSAARPSDPKCKVCRIRLQSAGPGCPWPDCPHKGFGVCE